MKFFCLLLNTCFTLIFAQLQTGCNAYTYYPTTMNVPLPDTALDFTGRVGDSNMHGAFSPTKHLFLTGSYQYKDRLGGKYYILSAENTYHKTYLTELGIGYMGRLKTSTFLDEMKLPMQAGYGFGSLNYWYKTYGGYPIGRNELRYSLHSRLKRYFFQLTVSPFQKEGMETALSLRANRTTYYQNEIGGEKQEELASKREVLMAHPDWANRSEVSLYHMDLALTFRQDVFPFMLMAQSGYSYCLNYPYESRAQFSRFWLEFSVGFHLGVHAARKRLKEGKFVDWW